MTISNTLHAAHIWNLAAEARLLAFNCFYCYSRVQWNRWMYHRLCIWILVTKRLSSV